MDHQQKTSRPSAMFPLFATKPMVIPSKGARRNAHAVGHGHHARQKNDIPPAVAALLAVTTIPRHASKKQPRGGRRPVDDNTIFYGPPTPPSSRFDCDVEIEDGSAGEELFPSQNNTSSKATLEMLLSSPEDDDDDDESSEMSRSSSEEGLLSLRSTSTESVPYLEADDESTLSFSSSYSTSQRRGCTDPRARIIASPPEECDTDHPLLSSSLQKENNNLALSQQQPTFSFTEEGLKKVTRRLNLRSNLTASLQVLKSAAKSFSSLTATAASMQPDDYLTRSILSIPLPYTDEKRPALTKEVPTPAVRRYLNPWAATYDDAPCTGAIQMQTYYQSGRKSGRSGRRAEAETSPSPRAMAEPTVRQRESRENSNFLRVIVLEMNMRREGKLSDTAQGRARFVLPPRQPCKLRVLGDPSRWEALVYED